MAQVHPAYYSSGAPRYCQHCKSRDMFDKVTDTVAGVASEFYVICSDCNETLAFCAYGTYDPAYYIQASENDK